MWSASMALNGIISAGTNGDWAAHMIGHELTSLYKLEHGISVGIVMPVLLDILREQKHERLVKYARNVWELESSSDDYLIDKAISLTRGFFEEIAEGKLTLENFNIPSEAANLVSKRIDERNWRLGELQNIDKALIRKIVSNC